jgi:hypothetical protein
MKAEAKPSSRQIQSATLAHWIVSSLYLLAMGWSLLAKADGYQPWLRFAANANVHHILQDGPFAGGRLR